MKKHAGIKKRILLFVMSAFLCAALCRCARNPGEGNPAAQPIIKDAPATLAAVTTDSAATTPPPVTTDAETEDLPVIGTVDRVSFLAAGDNMVYYGNVREARANAGEGEKYNFTPTYSEVKDFISSFDIAFVNQETLLTNAYEPSYYPLFCGPAEMGDALAEAGFDVVNIATNHMLDKGNFDPYHSNVTDGAGLLSSIAYWQTKDVLLIGGYKDKADFDNIRIYEKNGIKIAFLSYTYGTNGLSLSANASVYIPYFNEEIITSQIAAARERADFIIISAHWGDEYSFVPNDFQKSYAALMAERGVDVIIGHHPHVLQPVEWIEGKDGHKTLCVYSLGNFVSEMSEPSNMAGGMITFDIVRTGGSRAYIENILFVPTVYSFTSSFYENKVLFMEGYTEAMAVKHGISYYKKSLTAAQLRGFVKKVIDSGFLPEFMR